MNPNHDIPVFILAGGLGTRLSEETTLKPKPMLEIGEIPILIHIMKRYYRFGFNDFVICAGYKAWDIKQYFLNYAFRMNHLVIDHRTRTDTPPAALGKNIEQECWRVRVIDTGLETMTGGRVARAFDEIHGNGGNHENGSNTGESFTDFALTYGDGLCDVDLTEELAFHRRHGQLGTVLGVKPTARFGELDLSGNRVEGFREKPESRQPLINGGFFFFKREFRKYLSANPGCILEREPLAKLANDGQLQMYPHEGFWHPMDTQRDKMFLQGLWDSGKAPWQS